MANETAMDEAAPKTTAKAKHAARQAKKKAKVSAPSTQGTLEKGKDHVDAAAEKAGQVPEEPKTQEK